MRNSRIFLLIDELINRKFKIQISDPHVKIDAIKLKYKKYFVNYKLLKKTFYSSIVLAVNHSVIRIIYVYILLKSKSFIFKIND